MDKQLKSDNKDNDQLGLNSLKSVCEKLTKERHPSKSDVICDGLASNRILGLTLEESKTMKMRFSQYVKAAELIGSLTRTGHTDLDVVRFCQILYNENQPRCGHFFSTVITFCFFHVFCCRFRQLNIIIYVFKII